MQPMSPTVTTPTSGPCDKLVSITSALFLNATQVAAVKADISGILKIDDDIEEYCRELKLFIDLQKEIQVIRTDSMDYTRHIGILEGDLQTANKTIHILQGLMTNALTVRAIVLRYPPEYSWDRQELPNVSRRSIQNYQERTVTSWTTNRSFAIFIVTLRVTPRTKFNHMSKTLKVPWRISKP
jgi:hypothetical protein